MQKLAHNRRQRGAFTLVELLAVIVIIFILLALLLPFGSGIRERGRFTSCLSKLRQIGIAFQTFSSDHNGIIPGGYDNTTGPEDWQKEYMGREVLNPGETVSSTWPKGEGTLIPYLGVAKNQLRQFYRCPSLRAGQLNKPETGSNGRFDYTFFKIFAGSKLSLIPTKSYLYKNRYAMYTPLIVEEDPYWKLNNGNIDPGHANVDRLGAWHLAGDQARLFQGGSGNYMASDGSAHSVRASDISNRAGSMNGDTDLLRGPLANDWHTIAPSGILKSLGNTSVDYGDWESY